MPIACLALLLGGCAVTDRAIDIGGKVADGYLSGLDKARVLAETELARINAGYCLSTLPSIRRYAAKSTENRARIQANCGLVVELDTLLLR